MPNRLPSITIEGGKELADLLQGLADKEILSAVRKGMRAVGTKTMRDARKHLHKNHGLDTGQMRKSLGIRKILTYKAQGKVVMYVGPRKGFAITHPVKKRNHDPFFIAHLVEFGHKIAQGGTLDRYKNGKIVKYGTGRAVGQVKAYPFLRPAVDGNRTEFANQMAAKIKDVLTKARAKRGK